jgi:hypothetical protein
MKPVGTKPEAASEAQDLSIGKTISSLAACGAERFTFFVGRVGGPHGKCGSAMARSLVSEPSAQFRLGKRAAETKE